jgi:hypothetical protein
MATLTRKEAANLMAVGFALYTLQLEITDELEATNYYRQKLKQKIKAVRDELEELTNKFDAVVKSQEDAPEVESDAQKTVRLIEKFVRIIKEKDLDLINVFFDSVLSGEVAFMDGNKHKKILNQLDKI